MSTSFNSPGQNDVRPFSYPELSRQNSVPGFESPDFQELQEQPGGVEPGITEQDLAIALERGRQEGRNEAQQAAQERIAAIAASEHARINEAMESFDQAASEYYGKVEVELVHLALGIAKKILHREAQVDRMLVAALVKVAISNLKTGSKITVRVRPEDVPAWKSYFERDGDSRFELEVVGDGQLAAGDCVVQSELGTADLGIDAQLKEVERGLFDLFAQRPR